MKLPIEMLEVLVMVLCTVLSSGSAEESMAPLRETLFAPSPNNYGLWIPKEDPKLQAIALLQKSGSKEAISILKDFLTTYYGADRKLKQHALVALGRIGTDGAVAAIHFFEKWRERVCINPPPFRFGNYEHAIDHFTNQELKPLVKWKSADGREQAFFIWGRYGKSLPYVTTLKFEDEWESPILLDAPDLNKFAIAQDKQARIEGDTVILVAGNEEIRIDIKAIAADSNKDGIPDLIETLLGTGSSTLVANTGRFSGDDELFPLKIQPTIAGDEAEMRQAVFTVLFATSNNSDALVLVEKGDSRRLMEESQNGTKHVTPDFVRQEYRGFGGYVLKSEWGRGGFVNITKFDVKIESPTIASAEITDSEHMLAGSCHVAKLKKLHGKWVIVEFMMKWIS